MVEPLNRLSRRVLTRLFEPRERILLAKAGRVSSPPVFLVGPPRSGTTLLYQALTSGFHAAYFSNFAAWYPQTPVAATEFIHRSVRHYESDFTNDYGEVAGRAAPSEAQQIWKAWLGRDRTDGTALRKDTIVVANRTIAALQKLLAAPFVAKDISNALRTLALDRLFPGCLFVRVSRDPLAIAQSILRARHSFRRERGFAHTDNPLDEWIFINSRDYEQFYDRPYLEQIAHQVFHTENMLEEDLARLPTARILRINYPEFCRQPRAQLERFADFAAAHGLKFHDKAPIPAAFRKRMQGETKEGVPELEDLIRGLYANWQFARES